MAPNLETWKNLALIVGLAVAIVLGTITIYRTRREAHGLEEEASAEELYADLKAAYEAGQMDAAEFERVRASLGIEDPITSRRPRRRPG